MFGGIGIGNMIGSVWQYAQPPAGGNMFAKGSSGGAAGFASAMLGMFGPVLAAVPVIILLAVGGGTESPLYNWLAMVVGIAEGGFLFWWGLRVGGKHLDDIWPEALERVTWKN
jgi:ABC-2 type transport system permease protein